MKATQTPDYGQFSKALSMKLYETAALLNAINSMAEHHAENESCNVLTDIALVAQTARSALFSVTDELDSSNQKYQLID